ncbi:hypothetical protein [Laspinema palackyanum]|uniref:hypothetical protein n=1 Tax=Laspinema palackyanum TaxID=3231601 RepID=UPI00345E00FB|nr:hypothetical protein [Laspinema sp. D2c]
MRRPHEDTSPRLEQRADEGDRTANFPSPNRDVPVIYLKREFPQPPKLLRFDRHESPSATLHQKTS